MSAFHCTPSPNDTATTKVKDPWQCTEEDWMLILEAELNPVLSSDEDEEQREAEERRACEEAVKKAWEEAERQAAEACRVQEEAEKKEREEREAAGEAAEAWADAEQRAVEERLWDVVVAPPQVAKPGGRMSVAGPSASGWRASGVQDPCTWCCNKGTLCVLSMAKGKTMACEVCHHMKVSCSWTKKMAGEVWKKKWVHCLEETDNVEMVGVTTLDMLSMEFYKFQRDYWGFSGEVLRAMDTIAQELKRANDLKEEEMGKAKGKGKEKEEGPRRGRMEDKDGDTEMGGAGPSSLA
ncbi:hypothetical protein ID866_10706 [Astraeus odoratus]|nr:hypothetical protein ID866_10706 [Astraeus odoratus]